MEYFIEKRKGLIVRFRGGLPTPGARRLYLSDDEWQEAVSRELEQAQIILMNPGVSEGVRWEQEHIRHHCDPRRLLLCLASYWRRPDEYEDLVAAVRQHLNVELPATVPFLRHPAFVYFDRNWNPAVQELSYRCPILQRCPLPD